ncbi:Ni/Fe-hydrogenase small subunit [Helicobacter mustelae]|uniref:hydrogenase small subunit n=1 Tax=Helicobacter mustelae TaxID=217 RepID=UPI000E01732F|nr:hydrogenase small subunit [Helicobacter mustelae]STP12511.1 Ni/Fe-hydrogenase small subunit [Helicobacter mustelae]
MEVLAQRLQQQIEKIQDHGEIFHKEVNRGFVEAFMKAFKLPANFLDPITKFLSLKKPTSIIWLSLSECTGCTESFLRNEIPGIDSLLLEQISLDYHEVLMGGAGFEARKNLQNIDKGKYILVVEGSVCIKEPFFATFGIEGVSGAEELRHLAENALMVFGVGTCASFGGVQAANPNPTNTQSIHELISRQVVNIPGCPPSDINIVYSLMYGILFGEAPSMDALNRPLWAYSKTVHEACERKAKFESGDFVQSFDEESMKMGYCLYKVGCKGPYAYNNCPKVKFNSKTSWPIQAGHGCIACSEPNFWDDFGVFETPMLKDHRSFASKEWITKEESCQNLQDFRTSIEEDCIGIFLDSQNTQILWKGQNILEGNLEVNPRVFLQTLANKSKLTARLVENYKNYFSALYQKNMQESEESLISKNIADVLKLMHFLLSLEREKNFHHYALDEAMSFAFKKISDMDFGVKIAGDKILIDANKGMRLVLCYALGGLEYDGIAYGMMASLCRALREGVGKFMESQERSFSVLVGGDLVQNSLVKRWILRDE